MDYGKWHFYLLLFNSLLSFAAIVYAWWNTREKVIRSRFEHMTKAIGEHKTEIDTLKSEVKTFKESVPVHCCGHPGMTQRVDGHNDRLAQHKELIGKIESELKHLPTQQDLGKLHEKINGVNSHLAELKADVSKIAGAMPGVTHLTEMMNEFLLNKGGK